MGCTPFKFLYGYDPNVVAAPLLPHAHDQGIQDMMAERAAHTVLLKQHLQVAQNRIKNQAHKHRTDHEFLVGDQVLLQL
jgi:hypothetical protein